MLTGYDELYSYDGLYRLDDQKRGTLNGTQTAITSGTFEQQWGLDGTGNWKTFKQDNDGNGTWELNQTRTANKANEITGITNSVGAAWATPTYDPAGNMAGIPNPQLLTAEYDAWNRLVVIKNGTTKVSEHVYDARGYRIRKDTYTSGTLTEARHYYYTPGWQCVEERVGTSTTAERQFVWGLRYIEDLVLRDRSTANNGVINERRYAMQDGNWNTIAICDITGSVGERYAYSAYGTPVFMTGASVVQSSSPIGFETLYAGYRWDGTTPQMYYVRNRFLLPMIGTWNRRDPLGYVDGMGLLGLGNTISTTDSEGLADEQTFPPPSRVPTNANGKVQNGEFELEMTRIADANAKNKSGIYGTITCTPNGACPQCSIIKLAQTVRFETLVNGNWVPYKSGKLYEQLDEWRTKEDKDRSIFPGYHIDVLPECRSNTRQSIYYGDCTVFNQSVHPGSSTDVLSASIGDFPGAGITRNMRWRFETCAICTDNDIVEYKSLGCVHWGIDMVNGNITVPQGLPLFVNTMSPTFEEAIRIYKKAD